MAVKLLVALKDLWHYNYEPHCPTCAVVIIRKDDMFICLVCLNEWDEMFRVAVGR